METPNKYKQIGKRPVVKPASKLQILQDTWTVMKPFVKFSFYALRVIAHAFIFIVKHIPKMEHKQPVGKNKKVIKIS